MRPSQFIWMLTLFSLASAAPLRAADWPNWLGPHHNGSSPETGLLTKWPEEGPKILWKKPGGEGYSSIAIAGGRAITLVQREGQEMVVAWDAAKGTELWKKAIAPGFKNNFGNGPRSTPALEGDFVYVQSVSGPLVCLKADSGEIVWQKNLLKDFGAKNITWGLSASPRLDDGLVLAIPGAKGAGVAAFNKKNGELVWKSGDDKAAYASPAVAKVGGKTQYLFFTAEALLGVSPDHGKELWRVPWKTEYDVNITTPLVIDDQVFIASGEHVGSALMRISTGGEPETLWRKKDKESAMTTYWANAVVQDGYLYGFSGEFDKKIDLNCVDLKTGKLKWSEKDFGKGALTLADGHLFLSTKKGDLAVVRATPEKYDVQGRFSLLGDNRTVPTIAGGRLYVRDLEHVYCLDIAGRK